MNFDFFYSRTCFRTMTLYFKTVFKTPLEQWKNKKSTNVLNTNTTAGNGGNG